MQHPERGGLILEAMIGFALLAIAMTGLTYTITWISRQEIQDNLQVQAEQQIQQDGLQTTGGAQSQPVVVNGVTVATVSVYHQGGIWYAARQ